MLDHVNHAYHVVRLFKDVLVIKTGNSINEMIDSPNRVFPIAVPYGDTKYICIDLKTNCFKDHICSWVCCVKEIRHGYLNEGSLPMEIFTGINKVTMFVSWQY